MAQFRKDTHQFLGDGKTIFEIASNSKAFTAAALAMLALVAGKWLSFLWAVPAGTLLCVGVAWAAAGLLCAHCAGGPGPLRA